MFTCYELWWGRPVSHKNFFWDLYYQLWRVTKVVDVWDFLFSFRIGYIPISTFLSELMEHKTDEVATGNGDGGVEGEDSEFVVWNDGEILN